MFGVKKFHSYLYHRNFVIYSDHQPLRHLFGETRGVPTMTAARIQQWALTLSAYEYTYLLHTDQGGTSQMLMP